jgi:hypothetical protein
MTRLSLGFTGTQQGCTAAQLMALRHLLTATLRHNDIFRHGDCVGADAQAHQAARLTPAIIHIHPPTNATKRAHCDGDVIWLPRPYLDRNHDIVNRSDRLIACPAGPETVRSGTWSTVRYARSKGMGVTVVWPSGEVVG